MRDLEQSGRAAAGEQQQTLTGHPADHRGVGNEAFVHAVDGEHRLTSDVSQMQICADGERVGINLSAAPA
jgi:hypothetical protein